MARAKQTARAEARRRHRQANRPFDDVDAADDQDDDADEAVPASGAAAARPATRPAPGGRPGMGRFVGSFRQAYRQPNVREDLAALPRLVGSRGFLGAIGLVLAGALIFAAFPFYDGSTFLFQLLTFPPALAPIFVAGFFAPRASYLLGLLVGVIDAIVYGVLIVTLLRNAGGAPDTSQLPTYVGLALVSNAFSGIFFASLAAWYRRFLQLTNPNRGQARGNQQNRGRAAATTGRRRY